MQKLSEKEVLHIAQLASLTLSAAERALFAQQLSETLEYVAKLQKVETQKTSPTFQTTGLTNVSRKDEVKPSLSQKEALANAKDTFEGYFKVKAIFKALI